MAGQRAKASTAYASALTYLIAGTTLLAEDCWECRHELSFALELDRAECEFLTGALAEADQRLTALSTRAANTVERATVVSLRVDLYTTLDQSSRAIAVGLDYLRRLGIDWPPHPTEEEARREYERIWSQLGSRTIESLIELPLMTDPASLATLDVLTKLGSPAFYTDTNLLALIACRAVNLSLERGNCDASCSVYVWLSMVAGARFGDYQAAYRFGRLGYDLVEGHGLTRFQARTYMDFGNLVLPWTRHVRAGRDLVRRAFEAASTIGDLTYAAYCGNELNTNLLMAGDPLAEVDHEAEHGLAFAQKARFSLVTDLITFQLGLIRTLRGLTPTFGSFDDAQFDELRIERRLAANPDLARAEFSYWTRKLQARFFAGDYASAIAAASRAQRLLWSLVSQLETAEYYFYGALSQAAFCNSAAAGERQQHLDAVAAHHTQLLVWAANCPENFENRAALVGAEIARLEGRELDAERLYEQAIRSAEANRFVHNEALANELAARFYAARGFEKIARVYLQDARYLYLRWGADGKVRQLDQLYSNLSAKEPAPGPTSTIGAPVESLDLATVIKVSQAVSGEIVLEKLLDTLLRTAIEQAGAELGLLILSRGAEQQIAAEATIDGDTIVVRVRDQPVTATALPETIVQTVLRTREAVILDDAAAEPALAADPYIRQRQARSLLCLPLLNQSKLIGVLYLENNLAPRVFTPARISVLRLVASQAAIALENTRLYHDLAQREAKIRHLVDANIIGIFIWEQEGRILEANDAFLRIVGYSRDELVADRLRWTDLTPAEWRDRHVRWWTPELRLTGSVRPYEKEYFRKDGSRVPVLVGATSLNEARDQGVSFVLDLTERKRAEERLAVQHAVTRILAEAATVEAATPKILKALCEHLEWDLGALWRIDQQAGVLRCAELWRVESVEAVQFEAATRASTFRPGSGVPGRVWASRTPAFIPDATHDPTFLRADVAARDGLHAVFAFPILLGSEVLGVIDFISRNIRQPDQALLDMLATIGSQIGQFIERKRAERALQLTQADLAHVTRVTTMGELTASIAHEINQPLAALAANASACQRWLAQRPPNLDEAGACLQRMIKDSHRAGKVITRIRALVKKSPPAKAKLDLNDAIREVLALVEPEARRHAVLVRTELTASLLPVHGDRVQLQQVILNLVINGIEAMKEVAGRPRELWIRSRPHQAGAVLVSVHDNGIGLEAESLERVFEAFYTTKAQGMGMGLSISRSIIAAHGGQLWPSANEEHGATFQFTLPTNDADNEHTAGLGAGAGLAA